MGDVSPPPAAAPTFVENVEWFADRFRSSPPPSMASMVAQRCGGTKQFLYDSTATVDFSDAIRVRDTRGREAERDA